MSKPAQRLTARCRQCGETVKQFSTRFGFVWNCLTHGHLSDAQVTGIAYREDPRYLDGTPVGWIGATE